jgi:phage gp29-like protein
MLEAPLYGYKPLEIMWEYDGSYIIPASITGKPPEWFGFGQNNELRFKDKSSPIDGIDISSGEYENKFLLPRHKASYNNPYGFPILSRCFWYVFFKRGGMKFWVTFVEKYGMPWVFGRYRQGASDKERQDLMSALQQMIQDAIAVIPEGNSIDFPDAGDKSQNSTVYKDFMDFCNQEATIAILGHNGTSQSTAGKLGSEDAAIEVRSDLIKSDKSILIKEWNKLIRWIVDLNFSNEKYPVFTIQAEQVGNKDLAARDSLIRRTGWKPTAQYFRDRYGMKEEWFTIDDGATTGGSIPSFAEPTNIGGKESISDIHDKQKAIDTFADSIPNEMLQELAEGVLKPVIDKIEACSSYEEILQATASLFPKMDTRDLESRIAQARFVAYMKGRLDA